MPKAASEEIEKLHQTVKLLLQKGHTDDDIVQQLQKEGIDADYAQTIINNVVSDAEDKRDFRKLFLMGLFTLIGGLLINYFSYTIASATGALFFYLFWGIVVAGIVMLIKAFIIFRR
jgi:hypothetical protein